jgi:AcrR family transcriptional regulator
MATIRQPSAERRQQIIEATLRIISAQGVHRLTTLEIAREVGIADGTIFRHFQSKEEIIDAAIDHLEGVLFGGMPDLGEEPLLRLKTFFLYRLELVRKNPAVVRLAFTDRLAEAAGEASAAKFQMLVARSRRIVLDCIVEAQQRGEVARDIPAEVLVSAVIGVLRGAAMGGPSVAAGEEIWAGLERLLRRSAASR